MSSTINLKARILYSDAYGRAALAKRFNEAVASGELSGSVVISRDHHDVSGTDSPFRETSNIYDGSAFTADMAVQNCIGDSFRSDHQHLLTLVDHVEWSYLWLILFFNWNGKYLIQGGNMGCFT